MRKFYPAALLLSLFLYLGVSALAQNIDTQALAQTPKQFYQAVNAKDYPTAWALLSEATKVRLTAMVAQEAKLTEPEVRRMFDTTDPSLRDGFWESFRKGTKADVFVSLTYTYKGEQAGAYLVEATDSSADGAPLELIVKNEGGYKFGLAETFKF